jgi:dual specificity phosphatase 12
MSCILPSLWLGNLDILHDFEFLKENKITHVVTVLERDYSTHSMAALGISQMTVKMYDSDAEPIGGAFPATTAFIQMALESGGAVYVHCLMGMSRSPTIVAAYLIAEKGFSADKALAFLTGIRPIVDPNAGFRQALKDWEVRRLDVV